MPNREKKSSYYPIEEYGIIGDCHTAALVSRDGSIDWYCPSRFDAPAVFCRLLDARKGGFLKISPIGRFSAERKYLRDTNILETTFATGKSKSRVTDFMPVHRRNAGGRGYDVGTSRRILRLVEGLAGEMEFAACFLPTFDYAAGRTGVKIKPGVGVIGSKSGKYISLASPGRKINFKRNSRGEICGRFRVGPKKRWWFVLTEADEPERVAELPSMGQCDRQLSKTRGYWKKWAKRCVYQGPYRDEVMRSALTLKLLTYEPTGAIIAAPTTSLPEEIGGVRNWDYRFAWIRDSALILYALMNVGYSQEAADFFEWLQETHYRVSKPDLQVLYGINGESELSEKVLGYLEGYKRSRPVRVGNAAAGQLQLDIYGEALTAAYLYFSSGIGKKNGGGEKERLLEDDWPLLRGLVERAARRWQRSDNGIWEVRGGLKPFLYSKLMCWAAFDRGIRLAEEYSLEAPLGKWKKIRSKIKKAILKKGFDKGANAFTRSFGSDALDASALLIPRAGLLSAADPRMRATIDTIKSRLTKNGLVYRYRSKDGLSGGEGMFLACTFWLVDALALAGRIEEAHELFERASACVNDLGLFSEEVGVKAPNLLGNFPQGFTHMAQINAAINLAKVVKHGAERSPETETERAYKAGTAVTEGYSRR